MLNLSRQSRWLVLVGLATSCGGGCGSGEPYDMDQVSGSIRYDDGTLIPATRISATFLSQAPPIDARTHPRAGVAEVDVASGKFNLATTHHYGDGIVAGRHRVLITAYDTENLPTNAIPQRYRDPEGSPLVVDTADEPFQFIIPAPAR